jgi:hypothetical protein
VSTAVYRARSATELVDGAVSLLRANFTVFVTLGAVFYVPVLIVQWMIMGSLRPVTNTAAQITQITDIYGRYGVLWPILILWTAVWYCVIFTVASDAYLGTPVDIGSAVNRGLPRLLPTLGVSIIKTIGIGFASFFLLVPGILLALQWFAAPVATVLEPIGVFESFSRSGRLSRDLKWHIFKTYLIVICIGLAAYILIVMVGAILSVLARVLGPQVGVFTVQVITAIGMACVYPLWPITALLLYYDARIRKEGFDIELMSRTMGGGTTVAA